MTSTVRAGVIVFTALWSASAAAQPRNPGWRVTIDSVPVDSALLHIETGEVLPVPCPSAVPAGRPFVLWVDDKGVTKDALKRFQQDVNIANRVGTDTTCFATPASYPARLNTIDRKVAFDAHLYEDANGNPLWNGTLAFDIHTEADSDILLARIVPVRLASKSAFPIWLWNDSPDFPLTVKQVSVETGRDAIWTAAPVVTLGCDKPQNADLVVPPKTSKCVSLELQPAIFSALAATATQPSTTANVTLRSSSTKDVPEPHFTLTVYYVVDGAFQRETAYVAPVRFKPGLYQLLLALCLGATLGTIIRLVRGGGVWWQWLIAAAVTAICLEVAALILDKVSTRIVLFDVPIIPTELLPSVFVGIVAGLVGPEAFEKWENWRSQP